VGAPRRAASAHELIGFHTIIDDGRNFLLTTHETYDVILLEPPEMFTAGVVNLYTREFYEQARAHLAPDGLMMTWMPTGNMTIDDERQMFRAMWLCGGS
jgi:spermidine synthase